MTGAVTAEAQSFDGSANITFNVTALDGTKVSGTVPAATKAPPDGNGSVIHTTHATRSGAPFPATVTVGSAALVVTTDFTHPLPQTLLTRSPFHP